MVAHSITSDNMEVSLFELSKDGFVTNNRYQRVDWFEVGGWMVVALLVAIIIVALYFSD